MATTTIKKIVPYSITDLTTADAANIKSGVSGTGLYVHRVGNIVVLSGNVVLGDTFANDYDWHTIYTGLPATFGVPWCNGMLRFDNNALPPAMLLISGKNLMVSSRGTNVAGQRGLLFATYICND